MRSYQSHLQTMAPKKEGAVSKPVLRSSAIFPAIQEEGITTRLLFMGYWILKRHIEQIACVVTLRSTEGEPLHRHDFAITEAKTYCIQLEDYLDHPEKKFIGTLEVEFFSTTNMVFPFPAVVVNYLGPQFCTLVHTAQRVYNDLEDELRNSQTDVPESGFNIYADEDREPFFGLINGLRATEDAAISIDFYNCDQEKLTHKMELSTLKPYQVHMIYPARLLDLKAFLKGKVGCAKVTFHVNGIFPRLIAGNRQKGTPALAITHTYYDCTKATDKSNYWYPKKEGWAEASLMLPLLATDEADTQVYFYPIYSPSLLSIDVEIYNEAGELLGKEEQALVIEAPVEELHRIPLKSFCQTHHIPTKSPLTVRLIAHSLTDKPIPSRIKLGFDLGMKKDQMPCNICTNLQPFNPAWEGKPFSFKWAPILADQAESPFWIMNSSPQNNYMQAADVTLTFFREKDTQTLERKITLPPHGFTLIDPSKDRKLADFFAGKVGWVTAISTNPYTTTYYFALHPSGIVGGDHGF